ncbi:MAG: cytochrome c [Planctomycetaceae bacterium]|nr:MAG: cytochrome c [Planctomycetaceae bacterium]
MFVFARLVPSFWLVSLLVVSGFPAEESPRVDYFRDIKPIFQRRCVSCHGALIAEASIRLDAWQKVRHGTGAHPLVIPGDPDASLLIQVITGTAEVSRMPLEGPPLTEEEVGLLRRWIAEGAVGREEPLPSDPHRHWSFLPPCSPELPAHERLEPDLTADMTEDRIDWLLDHHRQRRGVVTTAVVSRAVWLRRVTFDLLGLPPTPEEISDFEQDTHPAAAERVVDRLLSDPRYGERWARHWMDVWRYSDWYGYGQELRNSARHIWQWRDWIVESLNADKPYDRMLCEMLAGDELAPTEPSILRATGFLARNYYVFNRDVWLDQTVEHTFKAFLGLTLNCARCHHHKYDPFSQRDYYAIRACFEPYDVRLDRVPGFPDVQERGLARVYDAHLDRATYIYERGDEKRPLKESPVAPGVPSWLCGEAFHCESMNLPLTAWYPGMQRFIREEAEQRARQTLTSTTDQEAAARRAWEQIRRSEEAWSEWPADAADPRGPHPQIREAYRDEQRAWWEYRLAQVRRETAAAEYQAVQARLAADDARFQSDSSPSSDTAAMAFASLAQAAYRAENHARVWAARSALTQKEYELASVTELLPQDSPRQPKKNPQQLLQEIQQARDKLMQAEQQRERDQQRTDYTPLTPVYPQRSSGRRLALARWITHPQHPLTARVAVNHVWLRHLGEPLVRSVFDFGHAGHRPEAQDVLDELATSLVAMGWHLKPLHRRIVLSRTYWLDSYVPREQREQAARDPDNASWWYRPAVRLEAEALRDSLLFLRGDLDERLGGPELPAEDGLKTTRRSLYYRHAPEKTMLFLQLFDGASPTECYRREVSITPQQSLALYHSHLSEETAAALAARWYPQSTNDALETSIFKLFIQVLGRSPSAAEISVCREFLLHPPAEIVQHEWTESAWRHLIHVLLNHHDFITVR